MLGGSGVKRRDGLLRTCSKDEKLTCKLSKKPRSCSLIEEWLLIFGGEGLLSSSINLLKKGLVELLLLET